MLIRRLKSHFFSLPCGVDVILGLNGYIWVSKHVEDGQEVGEQGLNAQTVYSNQNDVSARFSFYSFWSIAMRMMSGSVVLSVPFYGRLAGLVGYLGLGTNQFSGAEPFGKGRDFKSHEHHKHTSASLGPDHGHDPCSGV